MANTGNSIKMEAIREIAAAAVTNVYQVFGGVLTRDSFRIVITNATNGDLYISTDGTTNMMKIPSGVSRIYDDKTNDSYRRKGTQFYVKYVAVPGVPSGWTGIEIEYV